MLVAANVSVSSSHRTGEDRAGSRTSWQESQEGVLTLPSPTRGCAQAGGGREGMFVGASGRGPACNAVATGRLSGASPLSQHKYKPCSFLL